MTTWGGGGAPAGAVGGGGGLTVDPDGLRTAAGGFATVADAVTALAETLDAALSAEGQSWGSDEPGQAFGKDYVPGAQAAQQGLADLVTGLLEIQALLVRNADDLQHADTAHGSQYGGDGGHGGGTFGSGGGIGGTPAVPRWPGGGVEPAPMPQPMPMPEPLPVWPTDQEPHVVPVGATPQERRA